MSSQNHTKYMIMKLSLKVKSILKPIRAAFYHIKMNRMISNSDVTIHDTYAGSSVSEFVGIRIHKKKRKYNK